MRNEKAMHKTQKMKHEPMTHTRSFICQAVVFAVACLAGFGLLVIFLI